jgi:hypothetical protein
MSPRLRRLGVRNLQLWLEPATASEGPVGDHFSTAILEVRTKLGAKIVLDVEADAQ